MQRSRKTIIAIILLFIGLRLYYISGNDVFFYFDQARDATVVRDMVANLDIKIQGPSVSGTNDSVYHGVLYYYLIAPLYAIFGGNPTLVSTGLVLINLLGLFFTYKLGRVIFNSKKVGYIAAILQSVSLLSIHQSTWLSNPNLSAVTLPLVYLLSWKIFLDNKKRTNNEKLTLFIIWALALAASVQIALQNITLFGASVVLLFYSYKTKNIKMDKTTIKHLIISAGVFLAGISSMLLTQVLMFKRGILTPTSLNLSDHEVTFLEAVPKIFGAYVQVLKMYLSPYNSQIIFLIALFLFAIVLLNSNFTKKQIVWFASFFTAPLWLLSWHFRDPNHSFIGIEILLSLVFANGIYRAYNNNQKVLRSIAIISGIIFLLTNLSALAFTKEKDIQYFGIQKGAFLHEQLSLIDTTYNTIDQPFTFSTLTAPYAINTTWDYLYSWYGQKKYNQTPEYVGIQQAGFVSQTVLPQANKPLPRHALILEPDTTLSEQMRQEFLSQSDSDMQITYEFGTLTLYVLIQEQLHETILEN